MASLSISRKPQKRRVWPLGQIGSLFISHCTGRWHHRYSHKISMYCSSLIHRLALVIQNVITKGIPTNTWLLMSLAQSLAKYGSQVHCYVKWNMTNYRQFLFTISLSMLIHTLRYIWLRVIKSGIGFFPPVEYIQTLTRSRQRCSTNNAVPVMWCMYAKVYCLTVGVKSRERDPKAGVGLVSWTRPLDPLARACALRHTVWLGYKGAVLS